MKEFIKSILRKFTHIMVFCFLTFIKKKKKFILIPVDASRIGHLLYGTDLFFRTLSLDTKKFEDHEIIGFSQKPYCNDYFMSILKKKIKIYSFSVAIYKFISQSVKDAKFLYNIPIDNYANFELRKKTNVVFKFSNEDKEKGKQLLNKMGIGDKDWFVCFHARSPEYLKTNSKKLYGSDLDFSYHNFRDQSIYDFKKAIDFITSKGGYAIRMGRDESDRINFNNNKVIDYAIDYWSEFGDIYLSAHCKFFLGSNAGITVAPFIFNVPTIMTNYIPLCGLIPNEDTVKAVPCKIWSKKKNNFLSYKEIFSNKIWCFNTSKEYENAGIKVISSSEEEILNVTKEIYYELKNEYKHHKDDQELKQKFQNLIPNDHPCYKKPLSKIISMEFLRKNHTLLN